MNEQPTPERLGRWFGWGVRVRDEATFTITRLGARLWAWRRMRCTSEQSGHNSQRGSNR